MSIDWVQVGTHIVELAFGAGGAIITYFVGHKKGKRIGYLIDNRANERPSLVGENFPRVLAYENDATFSELISISFADEGLAVDLAITQDAAMSLASKNKYDVIICDLNRDLSGAVLLSNIMYLQRPIAVIYTGHTNGHFAQLKQQADIVTDKNTPPKELAVWVKRLLSKDIVK